MCSKELTGTVFGSCRILTVLGKGWLISKYSNRSALFQESSHQFIIKMYHISPAVSEINSIWFRIISGAIKNGATDAHNRIKLLPSSFIFHVSYVYFISFISEAYP